jgi:cytochrome c peroxidase
MRTLTPIALLLVVAACSDATTAAPEDPFIPVRAALTIEPTALPNYAAVPYPAYFAQTVINRDAKIPAGNPITDAGATLGRVLFFDKRLSRNDAVSCASCHLNGAAFGDTARFSLGFAGTERTTRHSMRLVNARFNESGRFFWDMRAPTLEAQTTQPIRDAVEMGFDDAHGGFAAAAAKVAAQAYYPPLFQLAFGDAAITEVRIQRALAQYIRSLVSYDSKWDRALAAAYTAPPGTPPDLFMRLPGFTDEEHRGQLLYMRTKTEGGAGCNSCHAAPTFALLANSLTNGLDPNQDTVFRSPSLKNVGQSRRFMHDGRFASLEEVVEFYDSGVQWGERLDNRLKGPAGAGPQRLGLSAADKAALVAFLSTLTDPSIGTDPRFTDPFRP